LLRWVVRMCAVFNAGGGCSISRRMVHHVPHDLAMKVARRADDVAASLAAGDGCEVRLRLSFASVVLPASGVQAGETVVLCADRVSHYSIRVVSSPASLVCCESWRGRGCASGFMATTVRPKQFPRRCAASSRNKFFGPPGPSPALRPLRDAARPTPAGRITTRTRWARPC